MEGLKGITVAGNREQDLIIAQPRQDVTRVMNAYFDWYCPPRCQLGGLSEFSDDRCRLVADQVTPISLKKLP